MNIIRNRMGCAAGCAAIAIAFLLGSTCGNAFLNAFTSKSAATILAPTPTPGVAAPLGSNGGNIQLINPGSSASPSNAPALSPIPMPTDNAPCVAPLTTCPTGGYSTWPQDTTPAAPLT